MSENNGKRAAKVANDSTTVTIEMDEMCQSANAVLLTPSTANQPAISCPPKSTIPSGYQDRLTRPPRTEKKMHSGRNISKPNKKVRGGPLTSFDRPCQHHSFLTEVTDVQQMEQGLLNLLDDFHSGKLQAFGNDCSFEKMEHVREQQERLARLHFDIGSQQEAYSKATNEDGRAMAKEHLAKLMAQLQDLSQAIEQLHVSQS